MDNNIFIKKCKKIIFNYFNKDIDTSLILLVWSCKTLQYNKAIFSIEPTGNTFGYLFELTYSGFTKEIYFDAYRKLYTECIEI